MNGFNFTERVRKVLEMARREAIGHGNEYVGPEHMLLALIREGEGVGATVLQTLDTNLDALAEKVETAMRGTVAASSVHPDALKATDLPYTSRAKKALELTMTTSHEMGTSWVGTEHLLIGLMREGASMAAQALISSGLTAERVQAETVRLLGTDIATVGASGYDPTRSHKPISAFLLEVRYADGTTEQREFANVITLNNFLREIHPR